MKVRFFERLKSKFLQNFALESITDPIFGWSSRKLPRDLYRWGGKVEFFKYHIEKWKNFFETLVKNPKWIFSNYSFEIHAIKAKKTLEKILNWVTNPHISSILWSMCIRSLELISILLRSIYLFCLFSLPSFSIILFVE